MKLVKVEVRAVTQSLSKDPNGYALVLGEVRGNLRLPIIIGGFEAQAIVLGLENVQPPRPMTHDLIRDFMVETGSEVLRVIIDELRDSTFYAKIEFSHGGGVLSLDARPSDAIAVAMRFRAEIFVAASVLEEAGIPPEDVERGEAHEETQHTPRSRRQDLERKLNAAVEEEDYELAASLRDKLALLKSENG